ncbi:MAG: hypothetical protein Q7S05_00280 [bacterium]|nr:hypothetical protein [bacterium]
MKTSQKATLYLPELYYFFDQKEFSTERTRAILVTAKKVSEWSTYYRAKLITPVKGLKDTERQGKLPLQSEEKHQFIDDLIKWIISNSVFPMNNLFTLFLDDSEIQRKYKHTKFAHPDDTCCWTMTLTEQQFQGLKTTWKDNRLPEDLFYKEGKEIRIVKPLGLIARFFGRLGFTFENSKSYSPKQWEKKQQKELVVKENNLKV